MQADDFNDCWRRTYFEEKCCVNLSWASRSSIVWSFTWITSTSFSSSVFIWESSALTSSSDCWREHECFCSKQEQYKWQAGGGGGLHIFCLSALFTIFSLCHRTGAGYTQATGGWAFEAEREVWWSTWCGSLYTLDQSSWHSSQIRMTADM